MERQNHKVESQNLRATSESSPRRQELAKAQARFFYSVQSRTDKQKNAFDVRCRDLGLQVSEKGGGGEGQG